MGSERKGRFSWEYDAGPGLSNHDLLGLWLRSLVRSKFKLRILYSLVRTDGCVKDGRRAGHDSKTLYIKSGGILHTRRGMKEWEGDERLGY